MSYLILFSLALLFFVIEILSLSFVFIFFALGFLIVGIISLFVDLAFYPQIFSAIFLSLFLLMVLKKPIQNSIKSPKFNNDFLNESGVGVVKEGKIYYKGTYFKFDNKLGLKEGDEVLIKGVKDNKIILKDNDEN